MTAVLDKEALRAAIEAANGPEAVVRSPEQNIEVAVSAYLAALPPHVEGASCRTCGFQVLPISSPVTEINPIHIESTPAGERGFKVGHKRTDIVFVDTLARDDGWIEWKGGKCPVRWETTVECRLRNGRQYTGPADNQRWAHSTVDGSGEQAMDIVAYRVVRS